MALSGILRTWHDDRGFGFIAPTGGGRELFVHVSAFPRDGSRPTAGEALQYEMGQGKDGKPQAVRVWRQALGKPSTYPRPRARTRTQPSRRWSIAPLVSVAIVLGLGTYGYSLYRQRVERPHYATPAPLPASEEVTVGFRCDGRIHCSQMSSCREAKYFLKHCPGTQMDGDNDGIPCEQQLCTSPWAK